MIGPEEKDQPLIFDYDNYRKFLNDFYVFKKSRRKYYSFRVLARQAGFSSSNFLKLVMQGKRNLTVDSIDKICTALNLQTEEQSFFKNLVMYNQAKEDDQRKRYAKTLVQSKVNREIHPLEEAQYEYFSKWYLVAIREMVSLNYFKDDPDWISKHLVADVAREKVTKAIEQLITLGLLERNEEGVLVQPKDHVATGDRVESDLVARFHKGMIGKAVESLEHSDNDVRHVSSVTFVVSKAKIEKVMRALDELRREVVTIADEDHERHYVYQMNLQLFPLTKEISGGIQQGAEEHDEKSTKK